MADDATTGRGEAMLTREAMIAEVTQCLRETAQLQTRLTGVLQMLLSSAWAGPVDLTALIERLEDKKPPENTQPDMQVAISAPARMAVAIAEGITGKDVTVTAPAAPKARRDAPGPGRPRVNVTKELKNKLLDDWHIAGMTHKGLAAKYELSTWGVRAILREAGAEGDPRAERRPSGPMPKNLYNVHKDDVLNNWATGVMTREEIAGKLGIKLYVVREVLADAARTGDPRYKRPARPAKNTPAQSILSASRSQEKNATDSEAGGRLTTGSVEERAPKEQARNEPGSFEGASAASTGGGEPLPVPREIVEQVTVPGGIVEPVSIPTGIVTPLPPPRVNVGMGLEDNDTVAGAAMPKPLVVPDKLKTAPPVFTALLDDSWPTPNVEKQPGWVIGIDRKAQVLVGSKGRLAAPLPIVKAISRMANGGLYDIKTLADKAGFDSLERTRDAFQTWKPRLEAIGIELVAVSKDLFKLRPLEA